MPETLMTDGYATPGAASAIKIGDVLKNAPGSTTVLITRAVLFVSIKSARSEDTSTELVTRPSNGGMTVSCTVALLPRARLFRKQFTLPPLMKQNPCDALRPTTPIPCGTWLTNTTFVAMSGPRFTAVMVYVSGEPITTGSGDDT